MSHFPHSMIEALESRIAPAGIVTISADGKVASWDDVDGDKVTLRVNKGRLDAGMFTTDQTPTTGLIVTQLDLTDPMFKGTSVVVTAGRNPVDGGNNSVDIGYINAAGQNLGKVQVNGDLGRIDAGIMDPIAKTPKAIASLTVFSMGVQGGQTLPAGVLPTSEVIGKVGPVKVRGNVEGILFNVTGGSFGTIQSLTITGSLIGTDDADSGRFATSGNIGPINIKGSILGGTGQQSGSIEAGGSIASLKVGSIFGGRSEVPSTDGTGVVRAAQNIGAVTIQGSIHGGTQQDSGLISSAGNMGAVRIVGGIVGGSAGTTSGGILVGGNVASINVKGDILGGDALESGIIRVGGKAGAITLLGALTGGAGEGSGSIEVGTDPTDAIKSISIARDVTGGVGKNTGVVHAIGKVGLLTVKGSLHGAVGEGSGSVRLDAGATTVSILGDIDGDRGVNSGRFTAGGVIKGFTLGGNLLGGQANGAGSIVSTDRFDRLTIFDGIIGGDIADSATSDLVGSGLVQAGSVGSLTFGTMRVGEDYSAVFNLVNNAAIRVQHSISTLVVKGSIEGTSDTSAVITARGQAVLLQNQTTDVAIGSVKINGSVRNAAILAGYDTTANFKQAEANPNAQVGAVSVVGDWIASDLVAGVAWNENFGDGTDTRATGVDNPDIHSRIASIRIAGQVIGTAANITDRFAFVAQEIGSLSVGTPAAVILLNSGAGNDNDPILLRYNLANTRDVRVFEIA